MAVQREEAYEDGLFAGLERGLEQGISQEAHQKVLETARNLLFERLAPQMVARCTGLPLETVGQLAGQLL